MNHKTSADILDPEHGTRYDDPDLIDAIREAHRITPEAWDCMSKAEQYAMQEAWVAPMPMHARRFWA